VKELANVNDGAWKHPLFQLTFTDNKATPPAHIKCQCAHIVGEQLIVIRGLLTLTDNNSGSKKRPFD